MKKKNAVTSIAWIKYIYTIYKENYPFQHTFGLNFSFQKYP